jgi:hypothetical protein
VGDGLEIRFWHDVWCEDQTLEEAFSTLNGIACFKEALVFNHL